MLTQGDWYRKFSLLTFDELDSTNEEAKRLAHTGASGEFIIWSRTQSKGKGRNGKNWVSDEGNLSMSIIAKPRVNLEKSAQISFVTAIALGEVIESLIPEDKKVQYKWPNDVVIDGKKVAGILLESNSTGSSKRGSWIIVGVGANLNVLPAVPGAEVTCIADEGSTIKVDHFLDLFMKNFIFWFDLWKRSDFSVIRERWLRRAYGLGEVITANLEKNRISGVFEGLDADGAVMIKLAGGEICKISSGKVFYKAAIKEDLLKAK